MANDRAFQPVAEQDVTERTRTEDAHIDSERSFRALANSIPQLAWMADTTGWIFWYNERWYAYTGTTLDEMQGWGWRKVHHPDHVHRVVERIRHAFETGEPWEDTFPLRSKTGEYRWFLSRALPIRDAKGNVARWFGTNTDVTEQLEAAAEREQLLDRERNARAEAERRRDELAHVTESRARLIRGFSHDVKNPLGVADGWAEALERGVYGELPETAKRNIGRIRRSIRHALEVIESLHELAHTEAGDIAIKAESVNVRELLVTLAEEYRVTAETAGLSLRIDSPSEVPLIHTDPGRVRQILGNLLSNALKYTDTGGVTLRLHQAEAASGREYVKVDVIDTGPGIAADQQERLFREFSRINPGDKPGAGLGLAISQRLAQMLGGRITLQSEQGRGSTFSLWLPAPA
jgi:PAS domain S-box-containing protein